MKKIFLVAIGFLIIGFSFGQEQGKAPFAGCPPGTCPMITFEVSTFNFHKPRTECQSGFGLCIRGTWGSDCKPCYSYKGAGEPVKIENGIVRCRGEIKNGKLELHIPAAIKTEQRLSDAEVSTFSMDDASISISCNGQTLQNKKGDYPVLFSENEFVVSVDLK
jgi:hypothetical protein